MFGRRKAATLPPPAVAVLFPLPQGARIGGTAGWKPMPTPAFSDQIGMYDGLLLNQYPARVDGVQLHSGREWGNTRWCFPQVSYQPNGSVQITTRPNNLPGGQRYGSTFTGPIGPINAKANAAAVTAAQVRQSGMAALEWARGLVQ